MRRKVIDDQVSLVTGLGLGFTIAIQVTTLTRSDFADIYSQITTASRFFALIGSYLAIIGLLLIARISWIESVIGHDRLVTWHRKSMPYALYFITAHILLVVLGYAGGDQVRIGAQLWTMITTYPWMLPATLGFIFLLVAGVTSYRVFRTGMSYETWWLVHILTYAAVAASFMHQIVNGSMFIDHPLNKAYWIGLYVVMALSIGYWRFWVPIWRSLKVNLRVEKVVVEGPGVISVIMKGRNLDRLAAQGGQFFGWRFLTRGHALMSHPYSLSAAPTKNHLRITVKDLGDHSRSLAFLRPGTRVFVEGPYGAFTAGRSTSPHVVLIGGGVGITPVRALMDEFNGGAQIDVIFRASRAEDLVLKAEMDYLADLSSGSMRIHYLVGSRKDHPMDARSLKALVPTFADSDIYICGPEPLVSAVRKAAEDLGVPKNRFHDEAFAFHSQ